MPLVTCTRYSLAFSWLLFYIFMSFSLQTRVYKYVCLSLYVNVLCAEYSPRSRGRLWKSICDGLNWSFFFPPLSRWWILIYGIRMKEFLYIQYRALADRRLSRITNRLQHELVISTSFTRDAWARDKWAKNHKKEWEKREIRKLFALV